MRQEKNLETRKNLRLIIRETLHVEILEDIFWYPLVQENRRAKTLDQIALCLFARETLRAQGVII